MQFPRLVKIKDYIGNTQYDPPNMLEPGLWILEQQVSQNRSSFVLKYFIIFDLVLDDRPSVWMVLDCVLCMGWKQHGQQRMLSCFGQLQKGPGFKPQLFLTTPVGNFEQDFATSPAIKQATTKARTLFDTFNSIF